MSFDSNKCAIATGLAFAIVWVLCSALVAILPGPTMLVAGHMMHGDMSAFGWTLTWAGFFVGLVAWSILAAVTAWLICTIYNRMK